MNKSFRLVLAVIFMVLGIYFLYDHFSNVQNNSQIIRTSDEKPYPTNNSVTENSLSIDELTGEKRVVEYLKANGRLPDCYITKSEAARRGWNAAAGNLCNVLPGKAIGGDHYSNRERSLPSAPNRQYFEADLNYNCGNRGADRVIFSNDGLIFVTHDHYQTFEKQ